MSEVLGDAEPFRDGDDFENADDYEYDDGLDTEPGKLGQLAASVATPEALAIAALIVATASLLNLPDVSAAAQSLDLNHVFLTSTYAERALAVGQLIVALVGGVLALLGRRSVSSDDARPLASWVRHVSGAALIVAMLSAVFAITGFFIASTAHVPASPGFNVGSTIAPAFPEPSVVFSPVP